MKELKSVFEGVFDLNGKKLSNVAFNQELKNPEYAFGDALDRISSRASKAKATYKNGTIKCEFKGFAAGRFEIDGINHDQILPAPVDTIIVNQITVLKGKGDSMTPNKFTKNLDCPDICLRGEVSGINFNYVKNAMGPGQIYIDSDKSIDKCSFNGFTSLTFERVENARPISVLKNCQLPDVKSISIHFSEASGNTFFDILNQIADSYNIPGCEPGMNTNEFKKCISEYINSNKDVDDRVDVIKLNKSCDSVQKLAKLLGLNSSCPKLNRIFIGSRISNRFGGFWFSQNGSQVETQLY